jgi:AbiV family abortive infection protein
MKERPAAYRKYLRSMIENAKRLAEDADVLRENERYPSAFLLATLALEEVGRVLLELWSLDEPLPKPSSWISFHIKKQAAVAFLLGIPEGNAIYDELVGESEITLDNATAFWCGLSEGVDTSWFISAASGAIEKRKQGSVYVELEDGEEPYLPIATEEMVLDAIKRVARAYLMLRGKLGTRDDLFQARSLYTNWLTAKEPSQHFPIRQGQP